MSAIHYSPIGQATANDIREIKEPGVMLPIREHEDAMLIFPWDDKMFAMLLTGSNPFIYFPISLKTPRQGLFVSDVEILVDFDSAKNGRGRDDHKGILLLEKNSLSVIGQADGDGFGDGVPVPLWAEIEGGSDDTKVAFERWAIGLKEGDKHRILWSFDFSKIGD